MALNSGFFNALKVNGVYDRRYNADDYSDNMGAIISNGVLRDGNDGFRVTAAGLVLSVSVGRAWIEGRWAYLDTVQTLAEIVPPVGENSRIDAVFLRLNTNTSNRDITLVVATGTASASPTAPAPTRTGGIYDLCLATVLVPPSATAVTVTDTRADKSLCGWITSPVGYDDYFVALDNAFSDWFAGVKDRLASATLFKQYAWRTVLESASDVVTFDIPQYDSTGVDIVQVYVNGLLELPNIDYTLTGSTVTFFAPKVVGTEIVVLCYKSIDGTGLGSVSEEVTRLQNQVAALGDVSEYNYICTGSADNVALSEIAQAFLAEANDGKTMTVKVYGDLGVSAPYGGEGTTASRYQWFAFGTAEHTSRRIAFDFGNCSRITIQCESGTHSTVFYGHNVCVKNAKVSVECNEADTSCVVFNSTEGSVLCESVVVNLNGYSGCNFAATGTFRDCSVSIINSADVGRCFVPATNSFLRIFGGDYRAYAATGRGAAVIIVPANSTAVVVTNGVSFPQIARANTRQEYAIYDIAASGLCSYINSVSTLAVSATSQYVAGTISANETNGAW